MPVPLQFQMIIEFQMKSLLVASLQSLLVVVMGHFLVDQHSINKI